MPKLIDPLRLCEQGSELAGGYPLAEMERLAHLLVETTGEVRVRFNFTRDAIGEPQLIGQLETTLSLICQRCLEPFRYPVSSTFKLAFVTTDRAEPEETGEFEPYLVTDEPISLRELVEDELLLCVPHVPKHELAECPAKTLLANDTAAAATQDEERQNPFAGLAEMMKRNKE